MRLESARYAPDRLIAEIAARQHGIVTFAQLVAAGISQREISRRAGAGRLHRIHRGIYAVGHAALTREGRWLAAVFACGEGAVLSHGSAAHLWTLVPPPANPGPIQVTVPGYGGRRRRDGITAHRSATLKRTHWMTRNAIPVTNPARTLADLRPVLEREQWESALDRARFLHLPIGDLSPTDPARSHLERAFRRLCHRHRLPAPEVNANVGPFTVDFLWRAERLIVETDGYEHHRERAAFERDRARDVELKLMGYEVLRFTYRQVLEEPDRVARTLRVLLSVPSAP